jgi:hypothetical protein
MDEKLNGSVPAPSPTALVAPDWFKLTGPPAVPATTTLPVLTFSWPVSLPPRRVVNWLAGVVMPFPTDQLLAVNVPP